MSSSASQAHRGLAGILLLTRSQALLGRQWARKPWDLSVLSLFRRLQTCFASHRPCFCRRARHNPGLA